MVRSAYVLAALLIPGVAVAQTTGSTTATAPDGRTMTVTTTRSPDGVNTIEARPAQSGGAPAVVLPNGLPQRDAPPATGTAVVRGRIIDAQSGTPLRRASVRIFGAQIRESRNALTDTEGRYEFTDLPAGQFNLTATKVGYVDLEIGRAHV